MSNQEAAEKARREAAEKVIDTEEGTAGGEGVTVEYKEYPEEWSAAKSVAAAAECTVEELNPGSTYQFRLAQGEAR